MNVNKILPPKISLGVAFAVLVYQSSATALVARSSSEANDFLNVQEKHHR